MNVPLSLVILAAGSSTRYGRLKQAELFGPDKLTISEYNILEAISCGINEVVFVVREQVADIFHKRLSTILPDSCKFSLVYQSPEPVLSKFSNRTKPWGTGHAVLSAKHCINNNFAVMNADDLYGADAIQTLVSSLKTLNTTEHTFSAVGYRLVNTLSEHGPVSRGIMTINNDQLIHISEHIGIKKSDEKIIDEGGNFLPGDTLTSMNLWGFTTKVFEILEIEWENFKTNLQNPVDSEFYLPHAINNSISKNKCSVKVLPTTSQWHGITYRNDKKSLESWLKK